MACGSCTGSSGGGCGCGSSNGCDLGCPTISVHDWMPGQSPSTPNLVEVKFKSRRRTVARNTRNYSLMAGDPVIIGVRRGMDFGHVTMTGELVGLRSKSRQQRYSTIIRVANTNDQKRYRDNRASEAKALSTFKSAIKRLNLKVKAIDAEWQLDRRRIRLFYSGERKIKSKKLVQDLSKSFKRVRVDLQFTNPRQETARSGGIGVCGRELCCSSWMVTMPKVTISAAKKQNLPLSSERLRGRCNRLKCCLSYELNYYVEILKDFPKKGSKHKRGSRLGIVRKVDILERTVLLKYKDGSSEYVPIDALKKLH